MVPILALHACIIIYRVTAEYFYLKAARDYCPTASSTGDLEMKGGDVLRVYRANNGTLLYWASLLGI